MRMTSKMTALIAATAAATVLLAGCASSSTSSAETADGQSAGSVAAVATGSDADITFAQLMIPHHEQAVQMADMALEQATSQEVIDLATQIKAAQDPEIQQMRSWLQQWGAPEQMDGMDGMDHGDMDMGGQTAGGMMSDEDMGALMDASGADFDRMWLTMMIAHHEGAIEMAEQVKSQSTNPDVTALADAIVAGQTTEIDTMQTLLDN
jgi:uncharacterized protein (DUF305 family)